MAKITILASFAISSLILSNVFATTSASTVRKVVGQYPKLSTVADQCAKSYRCQTVASFVFESEANSGRLVTAFYGSKSATEEGRGGVVLEGKITKVVNSARFGTEITLQKQRYLPICPINTLVGWPVLTDNELFEGLLTCESVDSLKRSFKDVLGDMPVGRCMFPICGGAWVFGGLQGTKGFTKKGLIKIVEADGVTPYAQLIFDETISHYVPDMDSDQSGM